MSGGYEDIKNEAVDSLNNKLNKEAERAGYHLNPDVDFTRDLVRGLLVNEARYGYPACPCRLATGEKEDDLDIICPCDYRDADLGEYDACYCALYVSKRVLNGKVAARAIPERRPSEDKRKLMSEQNKEKASLDSLSLPVWRCRVCGYLCARDEPPEVCPICKAKKDRFEKFI